MCKDLNKCIKNCHICRQHNPETQSYSYTHIKLSIRPFDLTALDLIGAFQPSSKVNTYALTYMCHLMNYTIAIPIPDTSVNRVIQAYLQLLFATFGGSVALKMDKKKGFKK